MDDGKAKNPEFTEDRYEGLLSSSVSSRFNFPNIDFISRTVSRFSSRVCDERSSVKERISRTMLVYPSSLGSHQ